MMHVRSKSPAVAPQSARRRSQNARFRGRWWGCCSEAKSPKQVLAPTGRNSFCCVLTVYKSCFLGAALFRRHVHCDTKVQNVAFLRACSSDRFSNHPIQLTGGRKGAQRGAAATKLPNHFTGASRDRGEVVKGKSLCALGVLL